MNLDFTDLFDALEDDIWVERPVKLSTFLYDKLYLGLTVTLSPIQFEIVLRGSQILNRDTLEELYKEDLSYEDLIRPYSREIILAIGKGSGKDFLSQLICCYIVYQLLCLKDPAGYFGKPAGDNIDIVNVAINAKQANNVFFSGLKTRIKRCPWFAGKYNPRQSDIEFNHNVKIHSLNSEGEGTEGLNILVAVLDEIDGFDENDPETPNAKKMYKTLRGTVASRFDKNGKVLILSFPRSKEGFILSHYNDSVAEKEVVIRRHTFRLDDSVPFGDPKNEIDIEWEEDHIISYKFNHVWALRRPTWDVNTTKSIDDFTMEFYHDLDDALARFAASPTDNVEGSWFPAKDKIDAAFTKSNGISEITGPTEITLKPDKSKQYYIHVDLARVQDNCAVSMAHVDKFQKAMFDTDNEVSPHVIVDVVRYWKPDRTRPVDFADVRDFIISLSRAGFNIQLVTFDRWNSDQIIEQLNSIGIKAEKLSVDRDHYSELALLMGQYMIDGPDVDLLKNELKKLVVLPNGKVDHTNKSSKDLSDAVCGAVYNASVHTPRQDGDLEVMTYADIIKKNREVEAAKAAAKAELQSSNTPRVMPQEIADFLDAIRIF
jgi:hypothetical protein